MTEDKKGKTREEVKGGSESPVEAENARERGGREDRKTLL